MSNGTHFLVYLMCSDLLLVVENLKKKDTRCMENEDPEFGLKTTILLPGGTEFRLSQPSHEAAFDPSEKERSTGKISQRFPRFSKLWKSGLSGAK